MVVKARPSGRAATTRGSPVTASPPGRTGLMKPAPAVAITFALLSSMVLAGCVWPPDLPGYGCDAYYGRAHVTVDYGTQPHWDEVRLVFEDAGWSYHPEGRRNATYWIEHDVTNETFNRIDAEPGYWDGRLRLSIDHIYRGPNATQYEVNSEEESRAILEPNLTSSFAVFEDAWGEPVFVNYRGGRSC